MIKHGHDIKMTDERGLAAFTALGTLMAMAERGGYSDAELKKLHDTIAPVLHRGANYSYRRSRTMKKRVADFPRDERGAFVKRTADIELPF